MKKMKVLVAALLAVTVVFGATVPANAAMNADVKIEIEPTQMDNVCVRVPTTLPIIFNWNGNNTIPTNWTVENMSDFAGIYLSSVELDANGSGWSLLEESDKTYNLSVGTKKIKFYVGHDYDLKYVEPSEGSGSETGCAVFDRDSFVLESGQEQRLYFEVYRGAFNEVEASSKAFDMSLYFEFR